MFYGKLPGQRAAGALFDVGLDERLLNFELFLREFKYAIFVDLVPDLTEKIGDIARGRCRVCGGCLGLLRQTMARKQQSKGHHRCQKRLSEPVDVHLPLIPDAQPKNRNLRSASRTILRDSRGKIGAGAGLRRPAPCVDLTSHPERI